MDSSKRRFVAYVESQRRLNSRDLWLNVRVPKEMAAIIERDCAENGVHTMLFYCDAFAHGLASAYTRTDVKSIP